MTIKNSSSVVNDRTGEDVIGGVTTTEVKITRNTNNENNTTCYFFNRDLLVNSPPKQSLFSAVKRTSVPSTNNNNNSATPVWSRALAEKQLNYHRSSLPLSSVISNGLSATATERVRKTMKTATTSSTSIDGFSTTPPPPRDSNNIRAAPNQPAKFASIAAHQFDVDSYEKQRKMMVQQQQQQQQAVDFNTDSTSPIDNTPTAGGGANGSNSASPTAAAANKTEFLRNFGAISRRLKEQDATNNLEAAQAMREFVGDHLLELMDKLKTSTSYDLKEELLVYLRDFMEAAATTAQLRTVVKLNDTYDSLCDCMNVFMRRRNSYEQGLSATIDILKMCAVQDKRFGSIMRRNDGIKLLCIAAKYFLGSTATKRFLSLVYIMRRLATNPRNVIIMWQNGTIKSFLLTIFASPAVGSSSTAAASTPSLQNGPRPTTASSTTSSSLPVATPKTFHRLRSPSTSSSTSALPATPPAVAGGRVVKDLLNILVIASKRSRALRSGLIEEIMRSMVRYLSTLRLPEDLKSRAGTVRLCAIIVRNLLSTKVARKTFRAFRGIEAVCAICDATRSMTLVHLCGQILMAQKIPKRLPLQSHRHPCQVPVMVAVGNGPDDVQMLTSVEDIAKITALAGCVPVEGSTGSVAEKLGKPNGANDKFLVAGDDDDNQASSSEDDDEDIEPLRRQRYLTPRDDNNDEEEDDESHEDNFDEEEDEEFEDGDEEEEEDTEKVLSVTSPGGTRSLVRQSSGNTASTELVSKPSSSSDIPTTKKDPYNYGPNHDFLSIDVRSVDELTNTYADFFAERNASWFEQTESSNGKSPLFAAEAQDGMITSDPLPLVVNKIKQPQLLREIFDSGFVNHVLPFHQQATLPTSNPRLIPFAARGFIERSLDDEKCQLPARSGEDLHRGSLKGRKSILREDLLRLAEPKTLIDTVVYDLDSHFTDGIYCAQDENSNNSNVELNRAVTGTGNDVPPLRFSGMFECGNLRKAIQIRHAEYDLLIEPDINNDRRIQWFYFGVENMLAGVPYRFNIINCEKETSQFNEGQQPIMFSLRDREQGWCRAGSRVFYYRNMYRRNGKRNLPCRSTTFTITFPHTDDVCYIAYHFPYSYSMLLYDLDRWRDIASQPTSDIFMQTQPLTQTLSGNAVHLVTITSRNQLSAAAKRADGGSEIGKLEFEYVVLTGRVHPSESNSSFIMRGCLDFLLSNHPVARALLERYVFKIVPMLNPDGVINGMTRGTMSTVDLNRTWVRPHKTLQPETYHTKGLLSYMCNVLGAKPFLFLDLHGHSRMKNAFLYGCDPNQDWYTQMYAELLPPEMLLREPDPDLRLFASTMADICPAFSLFSSSFKVTLIKEPSARVVMWRQLQCARSFTLESTFCGFDGKGKLNGRQINQRDLHTIGRDLMRALFRITKWPFDFQPPIDVIAT